MYSLYSLDVRITPKCVDELPLTAIEVKNQQYQLNQQENKSTMTKNISRGKRSLWRVLGYRKKLRHIRTVQRKELSERELAKHEVEGFGWKIQRATKLCQRETSQVVKFDGRRVNHAPTCEG